MPEPVDIRPGIRRAYCQCGTAWCRHFDKMEGTVLQCHGCGAVLGGVKGRRT